MRVLHVHNFYQLPGGEDQCFASTGAMLKDHGHDVVPFTLHNDSGRHVGQACDDGHRSMERRHLPTAARPDPHHPT